MSYQVGVMNAMAIDKLEQEGRHIQQNNPRFAKFGLMLTHPEFATFFDENFSSWEDCKHAIMLLKTGSFLRDSLTKELGYEISGHQLVSALKQTMEKGDTRRIVAERMVQFMKNSENKDPTTTLELISPIRNRLKIVDANSTHATPTQIISPLNIMTDTKHQSSPHAPPTEKTILNFLYTQTDPISTSNICRIMYQSVKDHKTRVNRILYGMLAQGKVLKQEELPPLWSAVMKPITPDHLQRTSPIEPLHLPMAVVVDLTSVPEIVWDLQHYTNQCEVWAVGNHATNQQQYINLIQDNQRTMHFRFVQSQYKRSESIHLVCLAHELFMRTSPKMERLYLCSKKKDLRELINVGAAYGVEVVITEGWHHDLALELEGS